MRVPHIFSVSFCLILLVSPTDVTTPIEKFSCAPGFIYIVLYSQKSPQHFLSPKNAFPPQKFNIVFNPLWAVKALSFKPLFLSELLITVFKSKGLDQQRTLILQ